MPQLPKAGRTHPAQSGAAAPLPGQGHAACTKENSPASPEHEWAQLHLAISDIPDSPVAGEKRTDSSVVNEHPITHPASQSLH
ncbi:MAG: hypothetical protein IPL58_15710 [Betaproteobacteria bacterium]|uniref:Uncharacterized protein n=1 Tax=Candidatus Proximibacter danicus TaxID=2954365 RepID=A0A9D7K355_9PROT|nr:hypothetical protein [Candidatus Proximibacter danicus]